MRELQPGEGRVERAKRTLQDGLAKELWIENVSDIDAGKAFLPGFVSRFNERFAVRPAKTNNLLQDLRLKPDRLNDILCHREQRHVATSSPWPTTRKQLIMERSAASDELGGQYVDAYEFPDGRLEVRSKGRVLPYWVFDKDQRVNPAAVVENKRPDYALSLIKAQQDQRPPPMSPDNSEKTAIPNGQHAL